MMKFSSMRGQHDRFFPEGFESDLIGGRLQRIVIESAANPDGIALLRRFAGKGQCLPGLVGQAAAAVGRTGNGRAYIAGGCHNAS
ncbi:MAG: hypothetical protein IT210_18160 [Armatimonadetes bacterium]|nr:hypothetical protein [Armatimonadota bacterium]